MPATTHINKPAHRRSGPCPRFYLHSGVFPVPPARSTGPEDVTDMLKRMLHPSSGTLLTSCPISFDKRPDDAGRGHPVPQFRPGRHAAALQHLPAGGPDALHIIADEHAGPALLPQGDRSLRVPSQGQAGGAQHTAFFLQTTAVGQHQGSFHVQAQHVVVAQRLQGDHVRCGNHLFPQAKRLQLLCSARVDGPEQRHLDGQFFRQNQSFG